MKKLIYIISAVLLLAFASGANAVGCVGFNDCKVKAEQGDAKAQSNLGKMYHSGQGVPQDYKKAVEWYSKATEQGNPIAQYSLGLMYAVGKGVSQDYVMAHMFGNIAGANGYKGGTELTNGKEGEYRNDS